jgi:diacylglycerol kinase family enzyme
MGTTRPRAQGGPEHRPTGLEESAGAGWQRRLLALGALVCLLAALGLAVWSAVEQFPRGLSVLACLLLSAVAGRHALYARGMAWRVAALVAVLAFAGAVVLAVLEGRPGADAAVVVLFAASLLFARLAFRIHVRLPPAQPPRRPVLFFNPKSGGGKAERFALADEAAARGIEAVELRRGADLGELVRAAVRDGADALAMAGGDGSQAIVAAIAAEHDLPYACIPAGTRNHFALDLGVDRDDVVGALDALSDGGERRVDLAEINGCVFVNNVSLGVYAEAVQREEYRGAKLRTLAETAAREDRESVELHWQREGRIQTGAIVLVSNNSYRLGRPLASGTRPRLDAGTLGVAVIGASGEEGSRPDSGATEYWTAKRFEVEASGSVPAGIDGEAAMLEPPLRFQTIPGALRVRIAAAHPGASPSALIPDGLLDTIAVLARYAFGRARPAEAGAPRA